METQTDNKKPFDGWEYAGFWSRTGAQLIDVLLLTLITMPLLILIYGTERVFDFSYDSPPFLGPADFLISGVFPVVATILFWVYKNATPGKW